MSNFSQRYKEKKVGFGDTAESRIIRAKEREEMRKKQRNMSYNQARNIPMSAANKSENEGAQAAPVAEDRLTRLMKWKTEREKRRRIEQVKKKPPFVVGVVHHKLYSPISNDQTFGSSVKHEKVRNQTTLIPAPASPTKRITRATQKRLMKKALTVKTEKNSDKNLKIVNKEQKSQKMQEPSFAPTDHKFKAPLGLSYVPLFGRVAIQSMSPARMSGFTSPFVKMLDRSRQSGTTEFIVEEINNKEDNTPAIDEQKEEVDSEESLIEPLTLKLSSDEASETFTYESNNDGNVSDDKVKVQDNSVHNNRVTETLSSLKKNVSMSTPNNSEVDPVSFSPYVVSSRGKSNARKEQQLKRGFSLNRSQSDDIPTKDTIMKTLNISIEEEERTAQYFQFLLNKEIDRLNELCKQWTDIKEEATTSEDGQYEINQAIGQTNLLINKKFERFRRLVADCETGKGEMLVTCRDLQGFWDMMYMEVKDCDARFQKLEKLRSQNWLEEQSPVPKIVLANKKKTAARKKPISTKSSSIRAFLAEKKKNITQQARSNDNIQESDTVENQESNNKDNPNVRRNSRRFIMFNESKSSTPVKQGKARISLLQTAQLSAASKSIKSPLTVIKVSQMCKTPDVISYINSNQTPGKSILKQSKNSTEAELSVKSVSKVNFDDDVVLNEIPVDEETRVKTDLATALARIDSFDLDSLDEVAINAERKLIFDDNSFEETEDDAKQNFESINSAERLVTAPTIKIETATPSKLDTSSSTSSSARSFTRQNAMDESDKELDTDSMFKVTLTRHDETFEYKDVSSPKQKSQKRVSVRGKEERSECDESIRVLRNRIVTTDTPRPRTSYRKASMNVQESEQKENKTPRRTRKGSVKIPVGDQEKGDLQNSLDKMSLNETNDKRKSRRSVKFSEECTGCVDNKLALPMTPHIKRNKAKTTEKKRGTITEDLTSWDTPETRPDRVRRSRSKKMESVI